MEKAQVNIYLIETFDYQNTYVGALTMAQALAIFAKHDRRSVKGVTQLNGALLTVETPVEGG